jgi:hypothetical protein
VQVAAERSLLAPWLPVSLVGVMIRGDVPARWNVAFSSMKIRPVCDSATTGLAERGAVKKSDRSRAAAPSGPDEKQRADNTCSVLDHEPRVSHHPPRLDGLRILRPKERPERRE